MTTKEELIAQNNKLKRLDFFTNQTINAESIAFDYKQGLALKIIVLGNLDGAKVCYKISFDSGATYQDYCVDNEIITQDVVNKDIEINIQENIKIKCVLTGVNSNTNITVKGFYQSF